ncbi:MAG: hypothetical protein ABIH46_11625 [Chloroflexota bacterium]
MKNPTCPFCEEHPKMRRRSPREALLLLLPESHTVVRMLGPGIDKSRGKWYQCPECRFTALFEKEPGEP